MLASAWHLTVGFGQAMAAAAAAQSEMACDASMHVAVMLP